MYRKLRTEGRKAARERIGAVFKATAFARFLLSGMNRAQWDRDRKLRTKEPTVTHSALPSSTLLKLGYGVKGPADVTASTLAHTPPPLELNVGSLHDRLGSGAVRLSPNEGMYQLRSARALIQSHLTALVALGFLRLDTAPQFQMEPNGVMHPVYPRTTLRFLLFEDSATVQRFSPNQYPLYSCSLRVMDDVEQFYRGFSHLITRPQLLLLACERELTVSVTAYGAVLRQAIESICAEPFEITAGDREV